jgi:UDP-N-acetylmuramate dehydrogenase
MFLDFLRPDQLLLNEPMMNHTTFRIGGPADLLALPESGEEIEAALSVCKRIEVAHLVIGNGSNLLFSDKGFRGVVIKISKGMSKMEVHEDEIVSQPGALLSATAAKALEEGLCGLEFASGIPGTLGGGVFMNAGAYGGELKDAFACAKVILPDGTLRIFLPQDMEFSYRKSAVQHNGGVLTEITLKLKPGDFREIKGKMDDFNSRRREKQPLELPSAGSTFKRPEGYFAGKLIMDSGLRGFSVGGAQISEKHCGFVVNKSGATCEDVLKLIEHVQTAVMKNFGVMLEPEVKIIPEKCACRG